MNFNVQFFLQGDLCSWVEWWCNIWADISAGVCSPRQKDIYVYLHVCATDNISLTAMAHSYSKNFEKFKMDYAMCQVLSLLFQLMFFFLFFLVKKNKYKHLFLPYALKYSSWLSKLSDKIYQEEIMYFQYSSATFEHQWQAWSYVVSVPHRFPGCRPL